MIGSTTGLTNKLFGVHDIYETIVDAKTRLPLKVVRNITEGRYKKYNETFFYHDIDSIYSQKSGWSKSPDNVIDILTVFFYFTHEYPLKDLVPGFSVTFPSYNEDKISDVTIVYGGQEKLNTDLGNTWCYVLRPIADKGSLLNRSDGMKFYISKESQIPIQMEFDMRVGSLRAILKSYTVDGVRQKTT